MTNDRNAAMAIEAMRRCYPNAPAPTPEYLNALMTLLIGKPGDIVADLSHPERGVIADCRFLPTVADVKAWLWKRLPKLKPPEQRLLAAPPAPKITEGERERVRVMLANAKASLTRAGEDMARDLAAKRLGHAPASAPKPTTSEAIWDKETRDFKLIEALENLGSGKTTPCADDE